MMIDSPAPSPQLPNVQRLAIALAAAGFQSVAVLVSNDPQVEDDMVELAAGYTVQSGSQFTYFAVNRLTDEDGQTVVEHLHDADSLADAVAWCVAHLPPEALGPRSG